MSEFIGHSSTPKDWAFKKAEEVALSHPLIDFASVEALKAFAAALREAEARGGRKASSRMTSIFEDDGRTHVTVALKPRMIQRLDELQTITGVMSRSDVIKNALLIYETYVKSRQKKGRRALSQEGRDA